MQVGPKDAPPGKSGEGNAAGVPVHVDSVRKMNETIRRIHDNTDIPIPTIEKALRDAQGDWNEAMALLDLTWQESLLSETTQTGLVWLLAGYLYRWMNNASLWSFNRLLRNQLKWGYTGQDRHDAALRLQGSEHPSDIRGLIKALSDHETRATVMNVLKALSPQSLPILRKSLNSKRNYRLRADIQQIIAAIEEQTKGVMSQSEPCSQTSEQAAPANKQPPTSLSKQLLGARPGPGQPPKSPASPPSKPTPAPQTNDQPRSPCSRIAELRAKLGLPESKIGPVFHSAQSFSAGQGMEGRTQGKTITYPVNGRNLPVGSGSSEWKEAIENAGGFVMLLDVAQYGPRWSELFNFLSGNYGPQSPQMHALTDAKLLCRACSFEYSFLHCRFLREPNETFGEATVARGGRLEPRYHTPYCPKCKSRHLVLAYTLALGDSAPAKNTQKSPPLAEGTQVEKEAFEKLFYSSEKPSLVHLAELTRLSVPCEILFSDSTMGPIPLIRTGFTIDNKRQLVDTDVSPTFRGFVIGNTIALFVGIDFFTVGRRFVFGLHNQGRETMNLFLKTAITLGGFSFNDECYLTSAIGVPIVDASSLVELATTLARS